jgi:hypothetical protein
LVIRVSRDPAENTSTSPLGRALAVLEAVELAELEAVELAEFVAGELAELEEELLQAAAVRPRQAMPATTANRLAEVRKLSILRR